MHSSQLEGTAIPRELYRELSPLEFQALVFSLSYAEERIAAHALRQDWGYTCCPGCPTAVAQYNAERMVAQKEGRAALPPSPDLHGVRVTINRRHKKKNRKQLFATVESPSLECSVRSPLQHLIEATRRQLLQVMARKLYQTSLGTVAICRQLGIPKYTLYKWTEDLPKRGQLKNGRRQRYRCKNGTPPAT